jgi:hypothetical protein
LKAFALGNDKLKNERIEMKKIAFMTAFMVFGIALFTGCASLHTWPFYERSAENKMVVIQENIGDGLKTNALTPDQSQMFLATLKVIRTDYADLRDKKVPQNKWDSLHRRLDVLGEEIDRAFARTTTTSAPVALARPEEPRNGDRIVALQESIDDGKISGRFPPTEGREFQATLDSIRREYFQMTESDSPPTHEERVGISLRLDSLAMDLNRFR